MRVIEATQEAVQTYFAFGGLYGSGTELWYSKGHVLWPARRTLVSRPIGSVEKEMLLFLSGSEFDVVDESSTDKSITVTPNAYGEAKIKAQ